MTSLRHPTLALALATVVSLCALAAWALLPRASQYGPTVVVSRADIQSQVTALGTLQPRRYVDVGAQASGQILRLHIEPGSEVEAGQLLVEIDPATQQARVEAGHAQIDALQAQLAEQRALQTLAGQQHRRQLELARGNATRTEDVQSAKAQLDASAARVRGLEAQIRQARAGLRRDEAELGYTRIYAPLSGTVVAVDAREGQTLNAQQQTPLILRIARLSPMTLWAQVSEADISRIKPGMTTWFTLLSGEPRRWEGKVRQILPVPPRPLEQSNQGGGSPVGGQAGQSRVVLYTVLIDVDNEDRTLMADMTAQVTFVVDQVAGALSLPVAAVQDDGHGKGLAWVLTADGKPEARRLQTGLSDRQRVQIRTGLAEGERVLVDPPQDVTP
ncbi:efflux RND transporter periplasmic adaptor subunit [Pseudomonas oryzihabitans]|uniref:Macrolide-specific efflux system membrane fusion protein n=1 Tax=Pseudomonas oryzihabitans TaxID=47885 RepID=A0AAJ2BLU2_9PSED|nr:efflux RND transporter periplasmic adaptor subunit [Pseudomonas psychrotolerans]MDR6232854.1 macrolide-specific efflux system membrane fusion protein [Pseudomonas psychrotolerans]